MRQGSQPLRAGSAVLLSLPFFSPINQVVFVVASFCNPLFEVTHGMVSGVYYPVGVLPGWLQPLSALSPATYTLSACRKLVGIGNSGSAPGT